jgi:hypothetical protein
MIGAIAGNIMASRSWFGNGFGSRNYCLIHGQCNFKTDSLITISLADSIFKGNSFIENFAELISLYLNTSIYTNCREGNCTFPQYYSRPASTDNQSTIESASMYPLRHSYPDLLPEKPDFSSRAKFIINQCYCASYISPIAYAYDDLSSVLQKVLECIDLVAPYPHKEVLDAQAVAGAIFLARSGKSKLEINEFVEDFYRNDLSKPAYTLSPAREKYKDAVRLSITVLTDSTDFRNTLRLAVRLGINNSAVLGIVGSLAEAYYGKVPKSIQEEVYSALDRHLGNLVHRFMERYCNGL